MEEFNKYCPFSVIIPKFNFISFYVFHFCLKKSKFKFQASDADTGIYGEVVYSLEGEGEEQFMIHPTDGHIQV